MFCHFICGEFVTQSFSNHLIGQATANHFVIASSCTKISVPAVSALSK